MFSQVVHKILVRLRIMRRKVLRSCGCAVEENNVTGVTKLNVMADLFHFIPFCGGGYDTRAVATIRGLRLFFPSLLSAKASLGLPAGV